MQKKKTKNRSDRLSAFYQQTLYSLVFFGQMPKETPA